MARKAINRGVPRDKVDHLKSLTPEVLLKHCEQLLAAAGAARFDDLTDYQLRQQCRAYDWSLFDPRHVKELL